MQCRRTFNAKQEKASGKEETVSELDALLDEMIERLDGAEHAKAAASEKEAAEKRMAEDMRKAANGELPPPFKLGDSDQDGDDDLGDIDSEPPTKRNRIERRRQPRKPHDLRHASLDVEMGNFLKGTTDLLQSRIAESQTKAKLEDSKLKLEDDRMKLEMARLQLERDKFESESKIREKQAEQNAALMSGLLKFLEKSNS